MIVDILINIATHVDVTSTLIFAVVGLLTWIYLKNRNLPPGPWGLPIVGYIPFLDAKVPPEEQFQKLTLKYGNVLSMQLGSYRLVVLGDFDSIKEAFVKQGDNFAGRPEGEFLRVRATDRGVINTDGEIWREQRRFALSTLRDYGMGKLSLEPQMMEEIHFFLEEVAKSKGMPTDFSSALGMSTANVISMLEFGKRFDYADGNFTELRNLVDDFVSGFSTIGPRAAFKWIRKVPFGGYFTDHFPLDKIQDHLKEFLRKIIEEHKKDYTEGSRKDYIDAFITERKDTIEKTGKEGYFDMTEELESTLQVLFNAGTETTTSTLRWGAVFLMMHPEMQKKIHQEIDDVIGMERAPTMSDQKNMKYTEAFLLEVQRYGSIVPLNLPHSNIEETVLNGYRIPKRSLILTNLWAVHHDPKLWKNPEKFQPERFINDKGQVVKPEYLMPFGIGKRMCLGEALGRMELFLYFTSLLQRFTILPPNGVIPKLDIETGVVRRPKRYEVLAVERQGYHVIY